MFIKELDMKTLCRKRELLKNKNGVICGCLGSGLLAFGREEILGMLKVNCDNKVIIVDTNGSYVKWVKEQGGQVICMSPTSHENHINLFDIDEQLISSSDDFYEHINLLTKKTDFLERVFEIPRSFKNDWRKEIFEMYEDYIKSGYKNELAPSFERLKERLGAKTDNASLFFKEIAALLSHFELFSGKTDIECKNKLVCFDLTHNSISNSVARYIYAGVLDYIWNKCYQKGTYVYINEPICPDELYMGKEISTYFREGPEAGMTYTMLSHDIDGLLRTQFGHCCIKDLSDYILLLRQKTFTIHVLKELLELREADTKILGDVEYPKGFALLKGKKRYLLTNKTA